MRMRTLFIFSCVTLLLLTSCLLLFQLTPSFAIFNASPAATVTSATSPLSTATVTAAPSSTETSAACTSSFCTVRDNAVSFAQALAELIALVIIIIFVPLLAWRIWKLWGQSNLVVDSFNNATGDASLDNELTGLNQMTRERLAGVLNEVRERINKARDVDEDLYLINQFPAPETASDAQITTLLASLQGIASPGPLQTALTLLNFVFAPHGTKISTSLQTKGDTRVTFGISFEISDLQNKEESILRTFWEPYATGHISSSPPAANVSAGGIGQQPASQSAPPLLMTYQQKANSNAYFEVGEQTELPKEDKDALASFTLGDIYEKAGALSEAVNQYKNALTKQPDYTDAREALKHILQTMQTPEDQLRTHVLPAAARWLAIEIAYRKMKTDQRSRWKYIQTRWKIFRTGLFKPASELPGKGSNTNQRKNNFFQILLKPSPHSAVLSNFIGYFHQISAQTYFQFPEFYDLAINDFNQAIDQDKTWYQPYENLADTYVMRAQEEMVQRQQGSGQQWIVLPERWQPSKQARMDLYQACIYYDKALCYFLHRQSSGSGQPGTNRSQVHVMPETASDRRVIVRQLLIDQSTPLERKGFARQLLIGQSNAQLLAGDISRAINGIEIAREAWMLEKERNNELLYNLACWYAQADRQHIQVTEVQAPDLTTKHAALRYITYSMARVAPGEGPWGWASQDPALSNILDSNRWEHLISALTQKIYDLQMQGKELSQMEGDQFKREIEFVLAGVH